jgi:hypothetical protein
MAEIGRSVGGADGGSVHSKDSDWSTGVELALWCPKIKSSAAHFGVHIFVS